jgi:hypothetical protein
MGARLNGFAEEMPAPAITLPVVTLLRQHLVNEKEERTIAIGREAWRGIDRGNSFKTWSDIGAALAIGKAHALRATGANRAWGRNYSHWFSKWMRENGFGTMTKSVRSVAIELYENLDAITRWRATLSDKQRRRLVHPLSNVRRWRAATTFNGKSPADYKMEAVAAWRRFVSCVAMLSADQAAPLWATVRAACDAP